MLSKTIREFKYFANLLLFIATFPNRFLVADGMTGALSVHFGLAFVRVPRENIVNFGS